MFKIVARVLLIGGGITIIFLGINFPPKIIMEMNHRDKNTLEKHLKFQKYLDLVIGFCFFILGILAITDILSGAQVGVLASLNYWVGRVAETRINKKYKAIE